MCNARTGHCLGDAPRSGRYAQAIRASVGPTVWLLYLERRHLSPRVQAFVEFLTTRIPPLPAWDALIT